MLFVVNTMFNTKMEVDDVLLNMPSKHSCGKGHFVNSFWHYGVLCIYHGLVYLLGINKQNIKKYIYIK